MTEPQHSPAGHAAESHRKTYVQVFIWLTILTIAEVAVALVIKENRFVLITLLCAMAVVKAGLVAAYFMHLKYERKTLVMIVLVPLILAGILILGLSPDTLSWGVPR